MKAQKILIFIFALLLLVTTVSAFPSTTLHYTCNGDYTNTGEAGGNKTLTTVGSGQAFNTTNQKLGSGACHFDGNGAVWHNDTTGMPTGNANHTFTYWNYYYNVDNEYPIGIGKIPGATYGASTYTYYTGDNKAQWLPGSAGAVFTTSKYFPKVGTWEYTTFVYWANATIQYYINATLINSTNYGGTTLNLAYGDKYAMCLNARSGDCLSAIYGSVMFDDVRFYNESLTQTQIDLLWNGGMGTEAEDPTAGGGSTDIDFTITDQWNGSNIMTFNTTVSWSNGSNTEHTTTNGTVSLNNVGNPGTINVTYHTMTNYFNKTLLNQAITENTTNAIATSTYQAEVCFNASEKVSGGWVSANNFTIGSTVRTSCFNISSGTFNVLAQKTGWYNKNQSFTIPALSNTTQTVQNMSYANLTIYAKDGNTNQSLSGYNLTIKSLNHTGWVGESASSVTNHSFHIINGTYNVTIAMPGYAVTEAQANITVSGNTNYTFYIYLANSVSITIRDEITNTPIYDNITIRWSDNTTTWENSTNTSTLFVSNITVGNYTLLFYSANYSTRTYSITVGPSSHQFLTAYMISSTYSTIFTIKDIDTGSILDGVAITMYKLINSTWTTVESKVSDISGKAQFYYDPIANYRFYLSATDYEDYVFYLNPILFSTYDVYMTRSSVLNYSVDFDDISFIYSPTTFNNNANTSMNFLISSPGGMLTDYGISVTYPGGNDTASGVNAIGEQMSVDVNVTNATAFDYVVLEFNYTTSLAGTRTYTFNLPINVNVTGGTWLSNKDKTYGLGIFERMLIATIIIIFVVGIATMVGQAVPGIALGLFVFGFLVFMGFIPLWAILPSMLIGVLFLIWKSGGY